MWYVQILTECTFCLKKIQITVTRKFARKTSRNNLTESENL